MIQPLIADILVELIRALVVTAGGHEEARVLITADEQRRANELADSVALARLRTEKAAGVLTAGVAEAALEEVTPTR